jgi:putative ABC transport system permease protein
MASERDVNILAIVTAEIRYRLLASIAMVAVVMASATTVFFFYWLSELAAERTRVIQRDLGLNLRILPAEADLESYWMKGYADGVIDQSLLTTVQQQEVANRLVPMLQRTVPWGDGEAILTGIGEEIFVRGESLKPVFGGFGDTVGELTLGAIAAGKRRLIEGDRVTVLGQEFLVKRVLAPSGSIDDIRVYGDLSMVQSLLEMPGKLNEIRALECECGEDVADPEAWIRETLEPLLPGTQIVRQDRLAETRRRQRIMADRMTTAVTPVLIFFTSLSVAGLAFINCQQRRGEIGLFVAVGMSAARIGSIIATRAALLGGAGGVLGVMAAWILVDQLGEYFVGTGAGRIPLQGLHGLLGGLLGSLIAFCGALVPAVLAAKSDPATTLPGD